MIFNRFLLPLFSCLLVLTIHSAFAMVLPSEKMKDPALQTRAQELYTAVRCVVCDNQNIQDSNAEIAQDLRLLIRTQLQNGKTNTQILDYIHDRYGDIALMKPRLSPQNYLLWVLPFLIFLVGAGLVSLTILKKDKKGNSKT